MSSGATPESNHSRQSLDSCARSPIGRPFRVRTVEIWRASARIEMAQRRRTDERPVPTQRTEPLDTAPIRSRRGRPPKKLHQPRIDGQRSRHEPEGLYRTAPSEGLSAEAGIHRYRAPSSRSGKPPSAEERARGAELVRDNTQVRNGTSCATSESSDPTFRRKADRRVTASPSDFSDEGERHALTVPVRSPPIVADRQPAASCETYGDHSSDRKRSGFDEATAFPRVIPSIPPGNPPRTRRHTAESQMFRTILSRPHRVVRMTNPPPESDDRTYPKAVFGVSQQEFEDTFPRFVAFRRNQTCRSLMRWFTSPTPSALRVSHPLSGLIPAHPCGCVSSHIRP